MTSCRLRKAPLVFTLGAMPTMLNNDGKRRLHSGSMSANPPWGQTGDVDTTAIADCVCAYSVLIARAGDVPTKGSNPDQLQVAPGPVQIDPRPAPEQPQIDPRWTLSRPQLSKRVTAESMRVSVAECIRQGISTTFQYIQPGR